MYNKLSIAGLAAILLTALSMAFPVSAAVAEWKSFDQKVSEADAIILGELVSSESRRDPDGRWIRTWSTFRVDEVLKGSGTAGTVTIVAPGGQVDGVHQETVGSPSFVPGREQVIFLDSTAEGVTPLYLDQGVYDVDRDQRGRRLVRPAASNLILYDDQSGKVIPAEATRTIEDFREQIRASLDQRRAITRSAGMEETPSPKGWIDFLGDNAIVLVLLSIVLLIAFITWMRKP